MQILFTRNNSVVSRLIRRLTGETVSHCAVVYDGFVYHSNFLGPHIETVRHFAMANTIVNIVTVTERPDYLMNALDKYEGSWYDFGAFAYMGLRCVFRFLPKLNLWRYNGAFLCTEWVQEVIGMKPDDLLTAGQLYELIKGTQ